MNVYIDGPIPQDAILVILRTQGGWGGPVSTVVNLTAANPIVLCDQVVRIDAFLVDDVIGFFMGTATAYSSAVWLR